MNLRPIGNTVSTTLCLSALAAITACSSAPQRYEPVAQAPVPAAAPVYYPDYPQWRHHYRPAPVVVEVPRYRRDWQPVAYPRYRDGRYEEHREWRHEERREDRHDNRHEHHDRRD